MSPVVGLGDTAKSRVPLILPYILTKCVVHSTVCSQFGPLESIRVFPGKTFAFVNFLAAADAIRAKAAMDAQV